MMKQSIWIGVVLAVLIGAGASRAGEYNITFHTGAVGGLYMEPGIIWADQMMEAIPNLKISCILGAAATNPIIVANGQPNLNLGISNTDATKGVAAGEGEFAERMPGGTKNLAAMWNFNVKSYFHILVRPDAIPEGVTTFGQLLEKNPTLRMLLKPRGAADELIAQRLFGMYGHTYESLMEAGYSVTFNNPTDTATLMIDGHADAVLSSSRLPAAFILDMESSIEGLRWLPIEPEILDKMAEQYGYYVGMQPTGFYTSINEEIRTIASDNITFTHTDMDEEIVYQMVKAVMADTERVGAGVPAMKTFDKNLAGVGTGIPLHAGAKRAYKELGLPYDE